VGLDGCDAAIFAAGARRRGDFGEIDGGGAAKLAEAADRFELRRFVLCSAIGADQPDHRRAPLRDFLAAKQVAEQRLRRLDLPWTIVRFGGLTDAPATGHITTTPHGRNPLTISRDDAAATLMGALERPYLASLSVSIYDLVSSMVFPARRPHSTGSDRRVQQRAPIGNRRERWGRTDALA
jgi:uncharacterized protein YbjT (DUF2867 family)